MDEIEGNKNVHGTHSCEYLQKSNPHSINQRLTKYCVSDGSQLCCIRDHTSNRVNLIKGSATETDPDSKFSGAKLGPIWGRYDPSGPHVGPMNFTVNIYLEGT